MKKVYLLPNLFTTANLFCGVTSIIFAIKGDFEQAAWLILVAMFFDFLDGTVARLTKSTSYFGLQYDSLCDLVSFGVAPSLLIYSLALMDVGRIGVAVIFVYIACAALRLARFNSQFAKEEKNIFRGLPSPAAAGVLASVVLLLNKHELFSLVPFVPIIVILISYLMVSHVRYPSLKQLNLKGKQPFLYLVGAILAISMAAFHLEIFLFCGFAGYTVIGILNRLSLFLHKKEESSVKSSH